jgi:DNA recombination protein RmuC
MNDQLIPLLAAVLSFSLGIALTCMALKGRIAAAAENAKASVLIELATARAQVESLTEDRDKARSDIAFLTTATTQLRNELQNVRETNSTLSERASRVPILENEKEVLLKEQKNNQQTLLGLTAREAEKTQELESKTVRLNEVEHEFTSTSQALAKLLEESAELREGFSATSTELKAEREALAIVRDDREVEKTLREQAQAEAAQLRTKSAELKMQLDAEQKQTGEKLELLHEAREALSSQFKSLANDILEEKTKRFTEQNQTNLGQLLEPLKTKINEFQGKVEEVYVQEGKDRSALAQQVRQLMELNQSLSQEAKNLTSALKGSSKTQGSWGELVLERVLEASGLRKGDEYHVQEHHAREDGSRALLDVVVHLPNDRHLVIDAKLSLIAYESAVAAKDDNALEAAIKRHLDSVRTHIKGLSDKNYQSLYGLKSLDCVLMFIPIEPAFMLAITHDRELFMHAWEKNVLLVSPSTLLFVVRTVAHLWRQEAQNRNALEIAKRGAELYDKLVGFVEDLESIGNRLKQAQKEYDNAHNKLTGGRGNVIRQAEMLRQLGVRPAKALPPSMLEAAHDDGVSVRDEAVQKLLLELDDEFGKS